MTANSSDSSCSARATTRPPGGTLPIVPAGVPFCPPDLPKTAQLFVPNQAFPNWRFLNPAFPAWRGDALVLPVPGFYFFKDGARTRVYLASSSWATLNANIAFSFAAGASNGCDEDYPKFLASPEAYCLSLFERWYPVRINCGPTSRVLGIILSQLGLRNRVVVWFSQSSAHQGLEVLLPNDGWTLYDPHFGLAYRPGVSGLDVFRRAADPALSADLQCCLPKHHWLEEPWCVYRTYSAAFGIVDPDTDRATVANIGSPPLHPDRIAALMGHGHEPRAVDIRAFEWHHYGRREGQSASSAALARAV